jgi:hypothetical protein
MSNIASRGIVSGCGHQGWDVTGSVTAMAVLGLTLACPQQGRAETFSCGAADVQCLVAAINAANANGEDNVILLEAGAYALMNVDNNTDGPNGLPSITSGLRIVGAGQDTTTVARDPSAPGFRLFHVGPTGNLTVEGMTLTGGSGIDNGALFNSGGVVTLTQSEVDNNAGGGLINNGGVVDIWQSTVRGNGGTGISNRGGVVNIFQSIVNNNRSGGLTNSGEVNITESEFAYNSSNGPGGLNTFGTGSTARIIRSRFSYNSSGFVVGGLYVSDGTVFIANSTFDHNSADGGGGIQTSSSSALVVTDSAFVENRSVFMGTGAGMVLGPGTMAVVTNTTFAGNVFDGFQGRVGVEAIANSGTLILTNSTLADNLNSQSEPSQNASAVSSEPNATTILVNTLLARNTGPFSQDCSGSVTSAGNNLIGDPTGCTIDLQPSDLTGDSGLDIFQDNGEPGNGHIPLLPTSPAVGAGNNDLCPPTDQLGHERVGPCDIGAIAFSKEGDPPGKSVDDPPTEQDAAATAQTNIAGLIANLAQTVASLRSTASGKGDLVARIKLAIDRAADLARGGAGGTSQAR